MEQWELYLDTEGVLVNIQIILSSSDVLNSKEGIVGIMAVSLWFASYYYVIYWYVTWPIGYRSHQTQYVYYNSVLGIRILFFQIFTNVIEFFQNLLEGIVSSMTRKKIDFILLYINVLFFWLWTVTWMHTFLVWFGVVVRGGRLSFTLSPSQPLCFFSLLAVIY